MQDDDVTKITGMGQFEILNPTVYQAKWEAVSYTHLDVYKRQSRNIKQHQGFYDVILNQKLDFITKGLSLKASLSYTCLLYTSRCV